MLKNKKNNKLQKMKKCLNKTMAEFINERLRERGKKKNSPQHMVEQRAAPPRRPAVYRDVLGLWLRSENVENEFPPPRQCKRFKFGARQKRTTRPGICDMLVNNASVRKLRGSVLRVHAAVYLNLQVKSPAGITHGTFCPPP